MIPLLISPLNITGRENGSSVAIARLVWLMRLRWLALGGVSASATLAVLGLVPGLNLVVITIAVFVGIASNVYIRWRVSHRDQINIESLHVGQAILDTLVLTLVLWAAGGAKCPFTSFYVFPVLLAVLLSGRHTFWPTALASLLGLLWQEVSLRIPSLQIGQWNPQPPWDEALSFSSSVITIGMVAYFATRFIEAMREQMRAKRSADELLRLSFERLEAGVELLEEGVIVWQNPYAQRVFGERASSTWRCPGHDLNPECPHQEQGCMIGVEEGNLRCRFSRTTRREEWEIASSTTALSHDLIFEVMLLSPSELKQRVAIYIDQTAEVSYQQKLMHTERLASLGRTAQGVAHELNTPLATIQTLGRDVLDVLDEQWTDLQREDVKESTQIILEEVQRCSRITRALLGRPDPSSAFVTTDLGSLSAVIQRSIALVFPNQSGAIRLNIQEVAHLIYPLDPLVQIFVNLLQNARDSSVERQSREVGLKDPPQVEILGELQSDGGVILSVIDEGVGLPAPSSLLFEPFFTTKSIGQGTGLGLYTSYALAKELGGEMSLLNHQPQGAIARVSLPAPSRIEAGV